MALVGAHLRNEPQIHAQDNTRFVQMRGRSVTAMWYQNPDAVTALSGEADNVICRLSDTIVGGRVLGHDEIRHSWQATLDKWTMHGVTLFVLDNEPNIAWKDVAPPRNKSVQWLWAWLMRRVLRSLAIPPEATLLLTPIAMPAFAENKVWLDEMAASEPGFPSVLSYCGGAAAHCYWQAAGDMDADWAGRSYRYVHQVTGLPIYITEAGCSTEHDTENRQCQDYPAYCDKVAADDYVKVLDFFILGSNGDWRLFDLTPRVCAAIASRSGAGASE